MTDKLSEVITNDRRRIASLEDELAKYAGWAPDQFLRYQEQHKNVQKELATEREQHKITRQFRDRIGKDLAAANESAAVAAEGERIALEHAQGLSVQLAATKAKLEEAERELKRYTHCRHASIDCFCVKEARAYFERDNPDLAVREVGE